MTSSYTHQTDGLQVNSAWTSLRNVNTHIDRQTDGRTNGQTIAHTGYCDAYMTSSYTHQTDGQTTGQLSLAIPP